MNNVIPLPEDPLGCMVSPPGPRSVSLRSQKCLRIVIFGCVIPKHLIQMLHCRMQ